MSTRPPSLQASLFAWMAGKQNFPYLNQKQIEAMPAIMQEHPSLKEKFLSVAREERKDKYAIVNSLLRIAKLNNTISNELFFSLFPSLVTSREDIVGYLPPIIGEHKQEEYQISLNKFSIVVRNSLVEPGEFISLLLEVMNYYSFNNKCIIPILFIVNELFSSFPSYYDSVLTQLDYIEVRCCKLGVIPPALKFFYCCMSSTVANRKYTQQEIKNNILLLTHFESINNNQHIALVVKKMISPYLPLLTDIQNIIFSYLLRSL